MWLVFVLGSSATAAIKIYTTLFSACLVSWDNRGIRKWHPVFSTTYSDIALSGTNYPPDKVAGKHTARTVMVC
jgi:hypothetical protein